MTPKQIFKEIIEEVFLDIYKTLPPEERITKFRQFTGEEMVDFYYMVNLRFLSQFMGK